jgi:hypothetical protein
MVDMQRLHVYGSSSGVARRVQMLRSLPTPGAGILFWVIAREKDERGALRITNNLGVIADCVQSEEDHYGRRPGRLSTPLGLFELKTSLGFPVVVPGCRD